MPTRPAPALAIAALAATALGAPRASALSGAELYRPEALRYGRFEARVRFAPGDGVVSSFFLWKEGSELPDVFWNEIDIEKVGDDCSSYSSNAFYGLPQSVHVEEVPAPADLCAGYHTHVIEWTPDHLAWILDGTEVRRLTGADLQAYEDNALPGMQFRFNLWVGDADFGGNFSPETLPVHQYLNWVSYSAYTPGAGPEGGDFTLAWREDFDGPLGADWSLGTWPSPFNLSVHSLQNFTVVDGKGVLSLTADDATGFSGQPPRDDADDDAPGEPPDAPEPPAADGNGSADGASPEPEGSASSSTGGGCQLGASSSTPGKSLAVLIVGLGFFLRRRRPRVDSAAARASTLPPLASRGAAALSPCRAPAALER